jgi:sugar phosphate isomerase/epimerase
MVLNLDHKKFAEANIIQYGGSYMKPMDFSYEDLESDLEAGSKAGFKHYELWNAKLDKYLETKTPSELKELCSSLNIDTPLYSLLPNMEDEHALLDATRIPDTLKQRLKLLSALGVRSVLYIIPQPKGYYPPEIRKHFVEPTRLLCKEAAEYDIDVGIEILSCIPVQRDVNSALTFVDMVDEPNFGVWFDTFQFYGADGDIRNILRIPQDRIFGLHVEDVPGLPRDTETLDQFDRVIPGEGTIDFEPILDAILKVGYPLGLLSVEVINSKFGEGDPFSAAKQIYDKCKTFFKRYL